MKLISPIKFSRNFYDHDWNPYKGAIHPSTNFQNLNKGKEWLSAQFSNYTSIMIWNSLYSEMKNNLPDID